MDLVFGCGEVNQVTLEAILVANAAAQLLDGFALGESVAGTSPN